MHSSRRIGDGRPRRLQAARFPGRIGRRPRPDSPSVPIEGRVGKPGDRGSRFLSVGNCQRIRRESSFPRKEAKKDEKSAKRGAADRRNFELGPAWTEIFTDLPIEDLSLVKRPAEKKEKKKPGRGLSPGDRKCRSRRRVEKTCRSRIFHWTRVKRPADRGSFTRTRVKRPADRGFSAVITSDFENF